MLQQLTRRRWSVLERRMAAISLIKYSAESAPFRRFHVKVLGCIVICVRYKSYWLVSFKNKCFCFPIRGLSHVAHDDCPPPSPHIIYVFFFFPQRKHAVEKRANAQPRVICGQPPFVCKNTPKGIKKKMFSVWCLGEAIIREAYLEILHPQKIPPIF